MGDIASTSRGLPHKPDNKLLADVLIWMDKRLNKFMEQILSTIDLNFGELRNDIIKDLREKYSIFENKVAKINAMVTILENISSALKTKLRRHENYPVSSELRINNIAFT